MVGLRAYTLTLGLMALVGFGCTGKTLLASDDAGASQVRTGPYDECGNGMDDDGDGLIDEGCFCGSGETQSCFSGMYPDRGVGRCSDGVQACDAPGTAEFGHWGACTMDTLPNAEVCDGVDNNCDGAVDEGCPCVGEATRPCGTDFSRAPCTPGTQTCQPDGTWAACEGAIGPSAESCGDGAGDGIDNDCDGTADEGCTCVPFPEVCGDGVDNDCDGSVDEAACTTTPIDGGADGGVPDGCTSAVEICDGADNDCDGTVDEGVCDACRCETWGTADAETRLPSDGMYSRSPKGRVLEAAFDGDGVVAFVMGGGNSESYDVRVWFALRRTDGTTVGVDRVLAPTGYRVAGVAWTGSYWVAAWTGTGPTSTLMALAPDGRAALAGPTTHTVGGAGAVSVAAVGDQIYVAYNAYRGAGTAADPLVPYSFIQQYDAALSPVGPPIELSMIRFASDMRRIGNTVVVSGIGEPGTTSYVALVRAGALVGEQELMRTATEWPNISPAPGHSFVAEDDDGTIVTCWSWAGGRSCRYLSPTDLRPLGPAFLVSLDAAADWDITRASCSMSLMTGVSLGLTGAQRFTMMHFDSTGLAATETVDRGWNGGSGNPTAATRLFAARDGRLIRVTLGGSTLVPPSDGSGSSLLVPNLALISTLRCREALAPVTDCAELERTACEVACSDVCPGRTTECGVHGFGTFGMISRAQCATLLDIDCSAIDAPRCREALAAPQTTCYGDGLWQAPADCVFL